MRKFENAVKHARHLPGLKSIIKSRRARVRDLTGRSTVEVMWDLNKKAIEEQVFLLRITPNEGGEPVEAIVSKQELEHYMRVI